MAASTEREQARSISYFLHFSECPQRSHKSELLGLLRHLPPQSHLSLTHAPRIWALYTLGNISHCAQQAKRPATGLACVTS